MMRRINSNRRPDDTDGNGSQRIGPGFCRAVVLAIGLTTLPGAPAALASPFRVEFSREVHAEPYTGRVYIFFSRTRREPRIDPSWFAPEMFIARDVAGWMPGEPLVFSADDDRVLAFPRPLAELELDGYRAQAVVRFNPWSRRIGTGAGNGYSQVKLIQPSTSGAPPSFLVDQLAPERNFPENEWCKLLRVRSKLLTDFYGREVELTASVTLPASYYSEPNRRYPTIFAIPGFGGTHFSGLRDRPVPEQNRGGVEFLRVTLDPSCPLGHHVFADSANNGPVGTALVNELLPSYELSFRAIADPLARFLTGHSSGGWSSLWVQINHPDQFGGTWSTAPDPVDFRDYQRIDLYRPSENMYVDAGGHERPLARRGDRVVLWYRNFAHMEWVLGYGGQLHSFEAVFSPRGDDGKPMLLWDRQTGVINSAVADSWKRYDIRLVLEQNWPALSAKLAGKLHVFMGEQDTFYLDGASVLLKEALFRLGSDAVVEIHPGKDHSTLMSPDMYARIRGEMVDAFLASFPDEGRR